MSKLEGVCRKVIEQSEWVSIARAGTDGPHLAATWGDYVRKMGIDGEVIIIPAGQLHQTEANLKRNPRVELLFATRLVPGSHGPGQGCCICGRGELQTAGAAFDATKARFAWARGAGGQDRDRGHATVEQPAPATPAARWELASAGSCRIIEAAYEHTDANRKGR